MADFKSKIKTPFDEQIGFREDIIRAAEEQFKQADDALKSWPKMEDEFEKRVLPRLEEKLFNLRERIKYYKLKERGIKKDLDSGSLRLRAMRGITIWHPRAWFVRGKLFLLSIAAFVRLRQKKLLTGAVEIAVAACVIYLLYLWLG